MAKRANNAKIMQHVDMNDGDEDGVTLKIVLDEMACGVRVTGVTLYVALDDDEDGDADLGVEWDSEGLQNADGGPNDEVGAVIDRFYTDNEYDARLKQVLMDAGFSDDATEMYTTESGMQDDGRASYEGDSIAAEVRRAIKWQKRQARKAGK